jgi:perosamine synthetase
MIPIFQPRVSERAIERVVEVLRSGWIGEGAEVRQFETDFSRAFGLPRALALNSGTAALHLAMILSRVGPGDEVIVPAQTFAATAIAVMQAGGTPVFADIEPDSPNIDPADVSKRITEKTKAIIVVHYGGLPCDMDGINAVARGRDLVVVEDAAHALGAAYKGQPAGAMSDFGVFSFQAIKQLTTGDGGMLACRDESQHREAYRRRWFGIDRERRRPSELGEPEWDIEEVGYKYHMNNIAAAMGAAHLQDFPAQLARRREMNALYRRELAKVSGVQMLAEPEDRETAAWLFTMLVERRLDFIRALKSREVQAAVWHQRIDKHPLFGGLRDDLPNQARFNERQVSIPMRPDLKPEEVEKVLGAVRQGW